MQTCFKTATVQKSIETLLENTFRDFENLSIHLDESKDRNRNLGSAKYYILNPFGLVEIQEELKKQHVDEVNALSTRISGLQAEHEKLMLENNDLHLICKTCDDSLAGHIEKIRSVYASMELGLELIAEMKLTFEESLQRTNVGGHLLF